tara:strand:+ start:3573 stop:4736 length:1164 start_codon:yes stop_codon:yes gene_type:complete
VETRTHYKKGVTYTKNKIMNIIKLNSAYNIDDGDTITFTEAEKGIINGTYTAGTLSGSLKGDVLKATFHNSKVNTAGLMEITFHEKGFSAKWKAGLEPGPMKGKWEGILETSSDFNVSIPDDIKVLLEQHLIKPNGGIDAVYNWFLSYYKNQFTSNEILSDFSLLKNELSEKFEAINRKNIRTIGIDFPIFLSKGKNRPILMICAMDPLRKDSDDSSKLDEIEYWVPFSIINSMESKHNSGSDRINLSFFHTLLETYDIYVTDIYKIFYREGQNLSNTKKDFKQLPVHKEIFENEIKIIKPHSILTLGNDARDAICQILDLNAPTWSDEIYTAKSKENANIIMVPHISGAARGTKAPILNNKLYADIVGTDNLKYARIITHVISSKL